MTKGQAADPLGHDGAAWSRGEGCSRCSATHGEWQAFGRFWCEDAAALGLPPADWRRIGWRYVWDQPRTRNARRFVLEGLARVTAERNEAYNRDFMAVVEATEGAEGSG